MLQRNVGALIPAVVIDRVPLAEGAAPAVLAAQANRRAFKQQRAERERFRQAPVDQLAFVHVGVSARDHFLLQLRIWLEILGNRRKRFRDFLQYVIGNACFRGVRVIFGLDIGPMVLVGS